MAIRRFRLPGLSMYYFDVARDCVMSTYTGQPRPMKWVQSGPGVPRRVGLTTSMGNKISYRYDQIVGLLGPIEYVKALDSSSKAAPTPVAGRTATTKAPWSESQLAALAEIRPNFAYVLYSVENRCSQYFFAGTSIREALERLAKRGEYVELRDVCVLNVETRQVTKLGTKVVTKTVYTLC